MSDGWRRQNHEPVDAPASLALLGVSASDSGTVTRKTSAHENNKVITQQHDMLSPFLERLTCVLILILYVYPVSLILLSGSRHWMLSDRNCQRQYQ
jgi:hypothetical protein